MVWEATPPVDLLAHGQHGIKRRVSPLRHPRHLISSTTKGGCLQMWMITLTAVLLLLFRVPQKRPHTFSCIPFKTWHPRERNVLLKMWHFITAVLFLIIITCVILFLLGKESNNNRVAYYSNYCDCNRNIPIRLSADLPPISWFIEETTWRVFNQNVVAYSPYARSDGNNSTSRYYVALDKVPTNQTFLSRQNLIKYQTGFSSNIILRRTW